MDVSANKVQVWTGLDPTPGAWDAWRIAAVGMRAAALCEHCGAAGHSVNECWTAHPELRPNGKRNRRCFRCNKAGHLVRNCPMIAHIDALD